MQKEGVFESITQRTADILILPETHATSFLQKSLGNRCETHDLLWGSPVPSKTFAGVAVFCRTGKAWAARKATFINKECNKYEEQGRLMIAQIFRGQGKRSLIIYAVYGLAGARWEYEKKQKTISLLKEVAKDARMRGDVASIICGDINLEPSEVPQ